MKDTQINFRISQADRQRIIAMAAETGNYFKPNQSINISEFCHDQILNKRVEIIVVDGLDDLIKFGAQIRKIGQNFNQLLHLIHMESHASRSNGEDSQSIMRHYDDLETYYHDLSLTIKMIQQHLENISRDLKRDI